MRYLLLLLLLFGCSKLPNNDLENGYYVTSSDQKINFFCTGAYWSEKGISGSNCVDMSCDFAGDRRIRSTIVVREGVVMETKGFDYKLVPCGPEL